MAQRDVRMGDCGGAPAGESARPGLDVLAEADGPAKAIGPASTSAWATAKADGAAKAIGPASTSASAMAKAAGPAKAIARPRRPHGR